MKVNEADILSRLNLGTSKEVLKNNPSSPLAFLLTGLAQDVSDQLRASIDKYDISASNDLKQSIDTTDVIVDKNGVTVGVKANFYWKFLQYGVNGSEVNRGAPAWGKQPTQDLTMSQSMKRWEIDRGITKTNGIYNNWVSLSKVEGMSMSQRGQIARPFFTDVVNEKLINYLKEPIEKVIGESIKVRILDPWQ